MSFKYPPASASVQKGNGFYRIKSQSINANSSLLSELGPGDLIPVDVGFSAIAVGPQSDYENYELIFPDPIAPGGVQVIPFSVDSPFVGLITADNSTAYPGSEGELAKAFIRIRDVGLKDGQLYFDPIAGPPRRTADALVDLIIYTGLPPANLNTKRVPNRRSGNVPVLAAFDQQFFIPGYGRKTFTLAVAGGNALNQIAGLVVNARVRAWKLYNPMISDGGGVISNIPISGKVARQGYFDELLPFTAVQNTPVSMLQYNAETGQGYYDFYQVTLESNMDALPSDIFNAEGIHLMMEVRD